MIRLIVFKVLRLQNSAVFEAADFKVPRFRLIVKQKFGSSPFQPQAVSTTGRFNHRPFQPQAVSTNTVHRVQSLKMK
jgi:hypothetical protein